MFEAARTVHVFTRKRDDYTALADEIEGAMQEGIRFRTLLSRLQGDSLFRRPDDPAAVWRCRFCGHLHTGLQAPDPCPVCRYPQSYFQINATNY